MRKMKAYKTYNFIARDPVIDVVRTMIDESGKTTTAIAKVSDVSAGTIRNWFRKTRRPQFATVAAVVRALGHNISVGDTRMHGSRDIIPRKPAPHLRRVA